MPPYRYKVSLSDGSSVHLKSHTEVTAQEIADHLHAHLGVEAGEPSKPFGSPFAKFAFPTGGAIATDIALSAPLMEAGGAIGSAIFPGVGTAIGAGLGVGAGTFLGALAGARLRQRLQASATQEAPPPFFSAVKEAAPFGAFGAAGEAIGAGAELAAPFAKAAPRVVKAFLRPGTMAHTALKSGAGGFSAGTTHGLVQGETLPEALETGRQQVLPSAALGAGIQSVPSFLRTASGQSAQKAARAVISEAEQLTQASRSGRLPQYLSTRGHEIFDKVKQVVLQDESPIPLKEFYDTAVKEYGVDSAQVATVLKAFGRDPASVMGYSETMRAGTTITDAEGNIINLGGSSPLLAKIFEKDLVNPQRALDAASELSSRIKGGARSGFKRGYSLADTVNADGRKVIYSVLKERASSEGKNAITDALREYGEFASLRNRAIATFSPFGNVQTPTAPGIRFLTRAASKRISALTPDDERLLAFLKEATGNDPTARLGELSEELQRATSQMQTARTVRRWVTRIGIGYPAIRAVFRRR